jgi:hypothetical protein
MNKFHLRTTTMTLLLVNKSHQDQFKPHKAEPGTFLRKEEMGHKISEMLASNLFVTQATMEGDQGVLKKILSLRQIM